MNPSVAVVIEKGIEKLRGSNVLLPLDSFGPKARFMPLDSSWWAAPKDNTYKLKSEDLAMGRLMHTRPIDPSEIVEGLTWFFGGIAALIKMTPRTARPPASEDFPVCIDVDWNALMKAQKFPNDNAAHTARAVVADLLRLHYEKDVRLIGPGGGEATFVVATCSVGHGDPQKLLHSFRL